MRSVKLPTFLKVSVFSGAALFLLHSLIFGAGRGLSAVPLGQEGLGLLRTATYLLLLIGAICYPKRSFLAAVFLWLGIVGRAFLELKTSIAKSIITTPVENWHWVTVFLTLLMYVMTFILPLLLAIHTVKLLRQPTLD